MERETTAGGEGRRLRRLLRQQQESDVDVADLECLPSARKESFRSAALLRGLGCSSSAAAQVYSPSSVASVVRSSADWQPGSRRKKIKPPWKKVRDNSSSSSSSSSVNANKNSVSVGTDIWCAPGIAFSSTAGDSVDCVVSQQPSVLPGEVWGFIFCVIYVIFLVLNDLFCS